MPTFYLRAALLLCFSLLLGSLSAAERSWPRWRGPADDGGVSVGSYPSELNAKTLVWKTKLPGIGCSTPAVWNEHILITSPVDGLDSVLSYDWEGKLRWKTSIGPERAGKHRNGSGSNPSPVTNGRRVFSYFKSGHLAGLDFEGRMLWKVNLQSEFAKDTLYWDVGTSPVLTENLVVATVMHSGESYLAAYSQETGALAWKASRNYKTPVEGDHGYSTPIVIRHAGREAILVWGAEHLTAHAADDGRVLWSCGGFNPNKNGNWVSVASMVVTGELAIVPYGRGSHVAAIKLGGEGDVTETHRVWTRNDTGSFVPSPAVHDGKLYLLRDDGEVECLDPKTGVTLWKDRFPKNRNKFYASPVVADGKIYAPREDGTVFIAKIGEKFELLSENDMEERMIASPVPVDDLLLLRGEQHLFCFRK